MNVFFDAKMGDDARRRELYRGSLFVNSPSAFALKLCQLAQDMIEEEFRLPLVPMSAKNRDTLRKTLKACGVLKWVDLKTK